jgi:hypothetical protein
MEWEGNSNCFNATAYRAKNPQPPNILMPEQTLNPGLALMTLQP